MILIPLGLQARGRRSRVAGLDEIRAAVAAHPGLLHQGESVREPGTLPAAGLVTATAALRLELHNLASVRSGSIPSAEPILERPYDGGAGTLDVDQLGVVRHILESREAVLGVEGKPGTGKTFALTAVRKAAPGRLVLELDVPAGSAAKTGRMVTLEPGRAPLPLDHAYAVTSHAAQGSTVCRVLATFDTRHSAELVNRASRPTSRCRAPVTS